MMVTARRLQGNSCGPYAQISQFANEPEILQMSGPDLRMWWKACTLVWGLGLSAFKGRNESGDENNPYITNKVGSRGLAWSYQPQALRSHPALS